MIEPLPYEQPQMFLIDGPEASPVTIVLAHGAGAPMDSGSMGAVVNSLVAANLRVVRFEFEYMASRRKSATKKPPPRADTLKSEYVSAIDMLKAKSPIVIGGKSMGGRVASMIADELYSSRQIAGLLCLGYPFHPIGKPEQLRTGHLADLLTPTLIVQGTRDPFGTRDEVSSYKLSKMIEIFWLEDGDHDLRLRKSVSGHSMSDHLNAMAHRVATWANNLKECR